MCSTFVNYTCSSDKFCSFFITCFQKYVMEVQRCHKTAEYKNNTQMRRWKNIFVLDRRNPADVIDLSHWLFFIAQSFFLMQNRCRSQLAGINQIFNITGGKCQKWESQRKLMTKQGIKPGSSKSELLDLPSLLKVYFKRHWMDKNKWWLYQKHE